MTPAAAIQAQIQDATFDAEGIKRSYTYRKPCRIHKRKPHRPCCCPSATCVAYSASQIGVHRRCYGAALAAFFRHQQIAVERYIHDKAPLQTLVRAIAFGPTS